LTLLQKYAQDGKTVEYYPSAEKLWKQFSYADKKWIENVIILWESEKKQWIYKIKNMKTWEGSEHKNL
jgi:histidyl-tRNA synthetase